jgi:hypothetical protein
MYYTALFSVSLSNDSHLHLTLYPTRITLGGNLADIGGFRCYCKPGQGTNTTLPCEKGGLTKLLGKVGTGAGVLNTGWCLCGSERIIWEGRAVSSSGNGSNSSGTSKSSSRNNNTSSDSNSSNNSSNSNSNSSNNSNTSASGARVTALAPDETTRAIVPSVGAVFPPWPGGICLVTAPRRAPFRMTVDMPSSGYSLRFLDVSRAPTQVSGGMCV